MNRTKLAPFIHGDDSVNKVHFDLLAALIPLIIISVVQNGLRVLVMCAISAFAAYLVEGFGNLIKRKLELPPFRVAILGICTTLLCPVTVPIWMPAVGVAVSVLFVRVILTKEFKNLFIGILLCISSVFSIFTSILSLPLYGFGCIIEDVKRIKENTEKNILCKE